MNMKKWLENISYKFQGFMQGRYGTDEFSRFLCILALIVLFLSYIPGLRYAFIISWIMIIWSLFRSFSKDLYKRQLEREKYLKVKGKITSRFGIYKRMWTERKTHKYYKCPNCKTRVRIRKPPKKKNIMVHCSRCGNDFQKRT